MVVGNDGEKVSFNVSEDTARAFARDQARVRSDALEKTLRNSQDLDYMTRMAKQIGASEAYSFLRDAKELKSSSTSTGIDIMTGFIEDYAVGRYGSNSVENITAAQKALHDMVTNQGEPGKRNFDDLVNAYLRRQRYTGSTTSAVHQAMNATRAQVEGQDILKAAVDQASSRAAGRTAGINQGSFSAPKSDQTMREPDGKKVIHDANHLRTVNRNEEAGHGRIQTTAAGMAKEGVGKVFQGGLVDSQGIRPTDEGYFDEIPTPVDGLEMPETGPIPKDGRSTLGKK
ncbi:hypothetical protein ACLG6S_17710 [Thermodesulfobacteriota bacterium B35]